MHQAIEPLSVNIPLSFSLFFRLLFLLPLFLLVKTGVSCAYTMDDVNNFVSANPAPPGCGNYVVATSNSNGNGYKVVRRCSNQYDPKHPENNFLYVTTYYYGKYSVTDWAPAYRGMWWNCDGIQAHTGNNYLPPGTGPRGAIFGSYREDRVYQYCFGDNYTETYSGSGFGWMRDERCFMGTQGPYQVDCSKYSETILAEFVPVSVCDLAITSFTGANKFIPSAGGSIKLSGSISEPSGKPVTWTITVGDKTVSGTGTDPSFSWDGKDASGKVVDAGKYTAVLSAKTDDGNCSDSKSLDFTVEAAPPGQCGLNVDFGSSAHVGSGNLSHSQNLFSSKGSGLTTSMTLYYNSLDPANGSVGRGWSHNYDISLKENNDGSVLVKEGNWTRRYYNLTNGAYVGGPGEYSTLVKNADGTFAVSEKDGTKLYFAPGGAIGKICDRNGNAMKFTYAGGNLTTITDPAGRSTTLAYDAANHLTSVTDPGGNAYTFGYSGDLLASVTNPDGGSWSYTYDTNAFMLSKTDPNGNTTSYLYDANHRIASATDPEGKTRSMAYPEIGIDKATSTAFTEKDGGLWLYGYDPKPEL